MLHKTYGPCLNNSESYSSGLSDLLAPTCLREAGYGALACHLHTASEFPSRRFKRSNNCEKGMLQRSRPLFCGIPGYPFMPWALRKQILELYFLGFQSYGRKELKMVSLVSFIAGKGLYPCLWLGDVKKVIAVLLTFCFLHVILSDSRSGHLLSFFTLLPIEVKDTENMILAA
jgi:hypothetical protein